MLGISPAMPGFTSATTLPASGLVAYERIGGLLGRRGRTARRRVGNVRANVTDMMALWRMQTGERRSTRRNGEDAVLDCFVAAANGGQEKNQRKNQTVKTHEKMCEKGEWL